MAPDPPAPSAPAMRVDKWLWHARFFKTRSLAAACVSGGHLRLNGARTTKPAQPVRAGDVLTFSAGRAVRVVRLMSLSDRRGPAPEARALYDDMTPPPDAAAARRQGRPSRQDRRTGRLSKEGRLE